MDLAILAIRLGLCGVFGVAGIAKLADLKGSREAMRGFGVPSSLAPALAVVLPIAEIGVAAALLFTQFSWFGSIGATALFAVFIAGMGYQMAKGNAPDCHCFGQVHSEPVSAKSIVRNVILLLPALFLVFRGNAFQGLSVADLSQENVQTLVVIGCLAVLVYLAVFLQKVVGNQAEIIRRIDLIEVMAHDGAVVERAEAGAPNDGLPIGALLPAFDLPVPAGGSLSNDGLAEIGRPSIFFFVKPTCIPCKALVPRFEEWAGELAGRFNVIFVSSGTAAENAEKFQLENESRILLQNDREFADLVHAKWTPSAIFVDANGRIASHVAAGDVAIEELVEKVKASDPAEPFTYFTTGRLNESLPGIRIGEGIPVFELDAIDGRTISSTDLKGKSTLVTFWSPTCPHCQDMLEQIRVWDKAKGQDQPNLIVFSDGDQREHMKIGLASPIVLDKDFKTAAKLGMHGTPSAVLIDEEGRYASELAIGATNIWALVGRR